MWLKLQRRSSKSLARPWLPPTLVLSRVVLSRPLSLFSPSRLSLSAHTHSWLSSLFLTWTLDPNRCLVLGSTYAHSQHFQFMISPKQQILQGQNQKTGWTVASERLTSGSGHFKTKTATARLRIQLKILSWLILSCACALSLSHTCTHSLSPACLLSILCACSLACSLSHMLSLSLACSLSHMLSLSHALSLSLSLSHAPSLCLSLACSLSLSLSRVLSLSLLHARSLSLSLAHTHTDLLSQLSVRSLWLEIHSLCWKIPSVSTYFFS